MTRRCSSRPEPCRAHGGDHGPSALSLIQVTFTEAKERARAFGVFGGISGGGAAIGLILGGLLTEYVSCVGPC